MTDEFLDLKNTKARAISLWEDEMSEWDFQELPCDVTVIIYSYKSGSWDWSGVALCKNDKGLWKYCSLSHCSCYGPLDNEEWKSFNPLEEVWSSITDGSERKNAVYEKAKEFIN